MEKPGTWSKFLHFSEYWYKTCTHSSTGVSPYELTYGRRLLPLIPFDDTSPSDNPTAAIMQTRTKLLQLVKLKLQQSWDRMKSQADKGRQEVNFHIGELVLVKLQKYHRDSIAQRKSHKLEHIFFGPFPILSKTKVAYKVGMPKASRIHNIFYVSMAKKFHQGYDQLSAELPSEFCNFKEEVGSEDGGDVMTQLPLKRPRDSPTTMKDFVKY